MESFLLDFLFYFNDIKYCISQHFIILILCACEIDLTNGLIEEK